MSRWTSRREESLVVERRHAVGLLQLASRIVQEDEVEVGPVPELEARQLAVADDGKAGLARRRAAARRAVLRDELAPRLRAASNRATSSAVSVSRSLTFISGNAPSRSATAMRKIAVRWNTRIAFERRSASPSRDALRAALEQRRELVA